MIMATVEPQPEPGFGNSDADSSISPNTADNEPPCVAQSPELGGASKPDCENSGPDSASSPDADNVPPCVAKMPEPIGATGPACESSGPDSQKSRNTDNVPPCVAQSPELGGATANNPSSVEQSNSLSALPNDPDAIDDDVREAVIDRLRALEPELEHSGATADIPSSVEQSNSLSTLPKDPDAIDDDVREAVIDRLRALEPELETMTEIAEVFHNTSVKAMRESTDMELCYLLDLTASAESESGLSKDYSGIAEWIGLETVYIRYLTRTETRWKTTDVLAKWITLEGEPRPTLGNLHRCLCGHGGIDRPDVITDLAHKINKDAFKWEMERLRANTTAPEIRDDSWQLTRQDVITGKRTYYTSCLVYADEDEQSAVMITNMFKAVKREAVFFSPQFDLKFGKYVHETTAKVIEERCAGKVIFVISEYFFASPVCQFTVHFAKGLDPSAEQGNLIPFKLTEKSDHVPRVLLGLAGIKWHRRHSRKNYWCSLATAIFGGRLAQEHLEALHKRIVSIVESQPVEYLSDPAYDSDTPPPGEPIPVYDPEPDSNNSDDPSSLEFSPIESDSLVLESDVQTKSNLKRFRHFVRKKIINRVFTSNARRHQRQLYTEEMQEVLGNYERQRMSSSAHRPLRDENSAQILTADDLNEICECSYDSEKSNGDSAKSNGDAEISNGNIDLPEQRDSET